MVSNTEKDMCRKKVRYANDASAQSALKKINPTRKLNKPTRVYKCPACFHWHLTSQR